MSIRILLTTVMIASVLSVLPFTMKATSVAPWTNQALAQGNDSEDINAPTENLQQYSKQSWPQYNDYQKQPVAPQRENRVAPAPQQPQYNQPQYNQQPQQPQYKQAFVCPQGYTCTRNRPKIKNSTIHNRIRGKRED